MFLKNRLSLFVLLFALTACGQGGETAAAEEQHVPVAAESDNKPTFIVFSQPDYPPLTVRNADGGLSGLDIDLLRAIGKVEGFNINALPHTLNGILNTLESGQADIISGISITPERQNVVDFSQPYLESNYAFFVDNGKIKNLADLQGQAIAVERGGVAEAQLRASGITDKIIPAKTMYLAFSQVKQGKAVALYGEGVVLSHYLRQYPDHAIILDEKNEHIRFGFAMVKDNTLLKNKIDRGFATIRANGTYQDILKKWTNYRYEKQPDASYPHSSH